MTRLGDVVPPRIPGISSQPPAVPPGSSAGIVRARQVIISGGTDFLLVYSGKPAAGNLVASITTTGFTDQYGNEIIAGGIASYGPNNALVIDASFISYYEGTQSSWGSPVATIEQGPVSGALNFIVPNGLYVNGTLIAG